jgi:hypothetical protein
MMYTAAIRLKFLALAVVLGTTLVPQAASAITYGFGTYDLTMSEAFGSGNYGSIIVEDLSGGTAKVTVNVLAPGFLVDTGAHNILTFSLAGGGKVDVKSISNSNFKYTANAKVNLTNPPFQKFSSAIESPCNGGNPKCQAMNGQSFSFEIDNFAGFLPATKQFGGVDVVFAIDLLLNGKTGAVGATFTHASNIDDTPPNEGAGEVPLPAALPLFATILGGGGVIAWRRKRKQERKQEQDREAA